MGLSLTGGSTTVRGLVINGFTDAGIVIFGANGCVISGNFLGTDPTGSAAVANNTGIHIKSDVFTGTTNTTVGGLMPADRNLISGNSAGVFTASATGLGGNFLGTVIEGNFIGTDATGTAALGNFDGIDDVVGIGGTGEMIGGTVTGAGNVISGNNNIGIFMAADGSIIQGNRIGTAANGTSPLGNFRWGIDVGIDDRGGLNVFNVMIGGTVPGAGNIIAFNGGGASDGNGIVVVTGSGHSILGNSIYANTSNGQVPGSGLGIDLGFDGVTLNDPGDADTGVNNLQNFPVLTSATNGGGMTTITGKLNSSASTTYRIEFFANDAIDPSGYGEGQTFIGFKDVTTNGNGDVSFSASFPQIAAGQRVTSTATDPNGNTSEFSGAIGQLLNISARMNVLTGNSVLIAGFTIAGNASKVMLLRALGPTLTQFGVTGVLADPTLELHDGSGALVMSNDNWKDTQQAAINATGKAPPNDLESAILHIFTPGNYTAIVRGKDNTTGIGLVEAYDIDEAITTALTNISTRGFVDTDQNVMIGGFISGNGIVRVIVRALGPTLSQFNVPNVLADPTMELRDVNGTLLASNDDWQETQQAEIQASGKAPPNAKESAIIIVRPAGNTTAIVRGKNDATGNALVEVYILP